MNAAEKEFIFERYRRGQTGEQIAAAAAEGTRDVPAFKVSASHARRVGREIAAERGELYARTPTDDLGDRAAVRSLFRRQVAIADRETDRLERLQDRGKLKPSALRDLAMATGQLHRLAERIERDVPDETPPADPDTDVPADDEDAETDPQERAEPMSPLVAAMAADAGSDEQAAPPVADRPVSAPPSADAVPNPPDTETPPKGIQGAGDTDLAERIRRAADRAAEPETGS